MDARHGPMRVQQQPAQRGGRGNASRLQPVDRDASFGSGSGIPEACLGGGTSGEATAGGSSSGRRTPDAQAPNRPVNLRTGSFRFQASISCRVLTLLHVYASLGRLGVGAWGTDCVSGFSTVVCRS